MCVTLLLDSFPCTPEPCIDVIFAPTAGAYWSATTFASNSTIALTVDFFGIPEGYQKHNSRAVRAVRGGL